MLSQPSFEFANVAQSVERIHGKEQVYLRYQGKYCKQGYNLV